MKGQPNSQPTLFACVRLDDLVPADHLLRRIQQTIDFSFIDRHTAGLYSQTGRPSVPPQVLVRMMLIGYLYGLTSERRLCQEVRLNLAYRWFCGLGLEDAVPDHSTFSKNRHGRFAGTSLFREMFYDVVRQAMAHGLVSGAHLTVDATTVQANAALDSLEPIVVPWTPQQYVAQLDQHPPLDSGALAPAAPPDTAPPLAKLSNATHRSASDPDARLLAKRFDKTQLAYSNNVLMDNRRRVIVEVEITEPNLRHEGQAAAQMVARSRFTLGLTPQTVGGDKAYGYGAAVGALLAAAVVPHVSAPQFKPWRSQGIFPAERFTYDAGRDEMLCPAGQRLPKRTEHTAKRMTEYAARVSVCRDCTLKAQCTRTRYRVVHRHWDREALAQAAVARQTAGYRVSQRCRKRIEHLFAEAKEQMGLRRARRRGRVQMLEQCLLTALVQNIKRIVLAVGRRPLLAFSQ